MEARPLRMIEMRISLAAQQIIRCSHCCKQHDESVGVYAEGYTTQIPVAVILKYSNEAITFREHSFRISEDLIETICAKCGGRNLYPLSYWEEETVKKNAEMHRGKCEPFETRLMVPLNHGLINLAELDGVIELPRASRTLTRELIEELKGSLDRRGLLKRKG